MEYRVWHIIRDCGSYFTPSTPRPNSAAFNRPLRFARGIGSSVNAFWRQVYPSRIFCRTPPLLCTRRPCQKRASAASRNVKFRRSQMFKMRVIVRANSIPIAPAYRRQHLLQTRAPTLTTPPAPPPRSALPGDGKIRPRDAGEREHGAIEFSLLRHFCMCRDVAADFHTSLPRREQRFSAACRWSRWLRSSKILQRGKVLQTESAS